MKTLKIFFTQAYFSFQALFGWARPIAYLFVKILNPIFQLSFFCIMAKAVYQNVEIEKYVVGNAIILCSYNCVFGLGKALSQERYFGTLKTMIVAPTNNYIAFLQHGVIHIFDSIITVTVALMAGVLLFQANLSKVNFIEFFLILIVGIFAASSLGLLLASFGLFMDNLNILLNILGLCFLVFTGANYPLDKLPLYFRGISMCLPLTRSISLGEILIVGGSVASRWDLLLGEFVIGLVYIFVGCCIFKFCEKLARCKGNLDLY